MSLSPAMSPRSWRPACLPCLPALLFFAGSGVVHPRTAEERLAGEALQEQAPEQRSLEVRALANEGFLLRAGDNVVAIDAFLREPYSGYGALSGSTLQALETGSGPFAGIDLALASHHHRDHFQAAPAQLFLAARPACIFASSPQVIDSLWEADPEFPAGSEAGVPEDSIRAVLPASGKEELLVVGGIRVEFLRLSHGTGRFAGIENLGHVITLGGTTALHVGDAAMVPATFASYRLRERGIDVAFVPYWYFDDPLGKEIIAEHLRPAKLVACHIPPDELDAVAKSLAERFADVVVPRKPLELFLFHDLQGAPQSQHK